MNRAEAREQIMLKLPGIMLQRDKSGNGYICPICNSGSGKNGTGMTENKKNPGHFTCWSNKSGECFKNASIIDIVGAVYGLSEYNDMLEKSCELCGIDYKALESNMATPSKTIKTDVKEPEGTMTEEESYLKYYKSCVDNRKKNKIDYLTNRGISEKLQDKFLIGYDSSWRKPGVDNDNVPYSPRMIIPNSKYSYLARDTRQDLNEVSKKYVKMKVGKVRIFNSMEIEKGISKPLFVAEGEINALSIMECGFNSIALGGVQNVDKLMELLRSHKPKHNLIIVMDNDESGKNAMSKLSKLLKNENITFTSMILSDYTQENDINDFLLADKQGLMNALNKEYNKSLLIKSKAYSYKTSCVSSYLDDFMRVTTTSEDLFYSTGLRSFDYLLGGGFYPGLILLGAESSLGKTTFALQVADTIAESGVDVLIFSVEMNRRQLMAKTISRMASLINKEKNRKKKGSKKNNDKKNNDKISVMQVKHRRHYEDLSQEQKESISEAIERYKKFADRVFIFENNGSMTIEDVECQVNDFIAHHKGSKPFVVVDYLQILGTNIETDNDKKKVDDTLIRLKVLSESNNIPILVISSFNRSSYQKKVKGMSAFKESGNIEYCADVLLELTLKLEEDSTENKNMSPEELEIIAKEKPERELELRIIKQRDFGLGSVELVFNTSASVYSEFRTDTNNESPFKPN